MLFAYKLTDDTGFAPNPFHGVLTLATCKPEIRASKKPGSFVGGFTSGDLCGDKVGQERLVFIMKITSKINYESYFIDPKFQCKKPSGDSRISKSGDNIYYKTPLGYRRIRNFFHNDANSLERDLKSDQVLLSRDFFYFGVGAIPVDGFKINIPRGQSAQGSKTTDEKLITNLWNYLSNRYQKNIALNSPHYWEEGEPF